MQITNGTETITLPCSKWTDESGNVWINPQPAFFTKRGWWIIEQVIPQPWQTVVNNVAIDRDVDKECKDAIDISADDARKRLVSPGQWVDQEYLLAFEDATKYAAAGFTGTVPAGVSTWAQAQGWTDRQAAEDILYQKAAWKYASDQIRALRLSGKAEVSVETTAAAKWAKMESFTAQLAALYP